MQTIRPKYASLSKFKSPTPRLLGGRLLKDVKQLQESIRQQGLLSPIIVSKDRNRLTVINGHKRVAALKRLKFFKQLPRDLNRVPYVMVDQSRAADTDLPCLSNRAKYVKVRALESQGLSASGIAKRLFISKETVANILGIKKLSPRLRNAYANNALSLAQVAAFRTIPNHAAQDTLLERLGPFAEEKEILSSIAAGDTVVELGGDIIILPSRQPSRDIMAMAA